MTEPTIPVILPEATETAETSAALIRLHEKMVKSIRSWGTWLVVLGVLQLFASNISEPSQSILLLIAGGLSFIYTHPSLFVLYVTTLILAAISNIIGAVGGGQAAWGLFALVQLLVAFGTWREHRSYRQNDTTYHEMLNNEGVTETKELVPVQAFPVVGCSLAAAASLLLVSFVVAGIALAVQDVRHLPEWTKLLFGSTRSFAILALSLSAASLVSGFRYRVLSIFTLAGSALLVLTFIVITLL